MHRRGRQAALLVAGIALLVFLPSVGTSFIYDDIQLILKNEYVHALKWLPRAFATHFWDVSTLAAADDVNGAAEATRRYYRPLVTVSFLLTWVVAGASAWVFHLTNVVLHAATAWLATRASIRWTGSVALGVVVGLLFAIHPTRSENVVWIAGRSDVLMTFFMLLSLEAFRRFEHTKSRLALGGAFVALVAAVLSKEPALFTPLLLLAHDRRKPNRLAFGIPAALCAAYAVGRAVLWRSEGDAIRTLSPFSFLTTVGAYAHRTLVPWPPTQYYDEIAHDAAGRPIYGWPLILLGALATAAAAFALVTAWRRSRTAFWLLVTAAGFMAPLVNLSVGVMKSSVQDRFLYAPLLFGAAAVARLLRDRIKAYARERAFVLAAAGLSLGAIGLIELRTPDYRNEDAFWEAELASHPSDPRALHMLGQNAATRGELKLAFDYFRRAREGGLLQRNDVIFIMSHFEQAAVLGALLPDGRIDDVRALRDELGRVVDPTKPVRHTVIEGFVVGGPLPPQTLQQQHDLTNFFWDAALLATRTGDFQKADLAVRGASPARTAAHPLNGALVLARIGRVGDAKALVAKVRGAASFQSLATARDYDALAARLERAEQLASARDAASAQNERDAIEALRLAELGAYWSALRVLVPSDGEETAPLMLQLLVACRLEGAAHEYARQHLGAEGEAAVAKIVSELPPALEEMAPVATPLDQVFAAAKRPL